MGFAAAGLAWAARDVSVRWSDRTVPLVGVMSAFVFAGQAVNFPIIGGTSGHLVGGMLAAVMLGPSAAIMTLSSVLAVQCLFFQDGGLSALGANVLNLALIGVLSGYAAYRLVRRLVPGPARIPAAAATGAWVSVVAASIACAVELATAGTAPLTLALPAMGITHAVIGLGEALITAAVVSFVVRVRPDLIYQSTQTAPPVSVRTLLFGGLGIAVGVAMCLVPVASTLPDGLEKFLARVHGTPLLGASAPDAPWWTTALEAAVGVLVSFAVAWCLAWSLSRWLRRMRSQPQP